MDFGGFEWCIGFFQVEVQVEVSYEKKLLEGFGRCSNVDSGGWGNGALAMGDLKV